ncbi:hypothetical protein AA309_03380 [Microvirga vignae]|uniref:Uncharacterized protein n=1 Tax=Microvirga vignae TaxID=1225564 RepID=A0A0H1RI29_9HYPH|nr:DUF6152 family protein [Microvirga vignae]KLK94496.1 hypothetical protein AA309_03380 [Microvirga vignae]
MKHPLFVLSLSSTLLTSGIAFAHHGWGSYDASKQFSITSTVQRADWQNPHVMVVVTHANKNWEAVLAPPFRMSARGLEPDMIKPGRQVTLEGYPSTRVENEMRAERITVGGKTFELR